MIETDRHTLAAELVAQVESGTLPAQLLDEAYTLRQQLLSSDSGQEDADIEMRLALLYRKARQFDQAASVCQRVLAAHPDNAMALHLTGSIDQCLGRFDQALDHYRRALQINPALAETHYFIGNIFQITGQPEAAADSYRQAIDLRPDYLEAMSNLGAVLMSLHRFGEARRVLEQADIHHPDCAQVLCNLGDLALRNEDTGKARHYAESVLRKQPDFVDAHLLLGKIARHEEDYAATLKHFYQALELQPGNENLVGTIAEIEEKRGDFSRARELLVPLIEGGSSNFLVLRAWSALSRETGDEERAIERIEQAIGLGGLDLHQQASLHSELGKQYDRLTRYHEAFEHYRTANQLERRLKTRGSMTTRKTYTTCVDIKRWRNRFGPAYWQNLPRAYTGSTRPVFVVGMPRSGTTLAEQILASHPAVHGAGELPDIPELATNLGEQWQGDGRVQYLKNLEPAALSAAAGKYLDTLGDRSANATRVVDKMPTNFQYLGLIALLFPEAPVIHMQRDPRDVCLSMYFQRFGTAMTFTTDLEELADYYLAYTCFMTYWKEVLDINILNVKYEELVAEPEGVIRRMVAHCGLEWNDSCLAFHSTERDVHTPSYDQVRQPLYSRSAGRWRHYEQDLAPLLKALSAQDQSG